MFSDVAVSDVVGASPNVQLICCTAFIIAVIICFCVVLSSFGGRRRSR